MIVITITNKATDGVVTVINESIRDDGRERVPNGTQDVAPGESMDFIVHPMQSVRVVEAG